MSATVTFYARPENRELVLKQIISLTQSDIEFMPEGGSYLSWTNEMAVKLTLQEDCLRLEREIQQIEGVLDAEVLVNELPEEEEINSRFQLINESLALSIFNKPIPNWYHHTIYNNEAIDYACHEYIAGRGFFNFDTSRHFIALIDTGYSLHPETLGFDLTEGRNFMPMENNKVPLDTLESTRPVPITWGGHGTSCAGVIIGKDAVIDPVNRIPHRNTSFDDLSNGLLSGNIKLVPFRVSRNIISFGSRMARAIYHVNSQTDINVISMSHATILNRKINYAAVREAYEKGIILVAAPGSHVFGSKRIFTYPAKYKETIAPAASTIENKPWKLTHGGPEVDLCAPGYDIYIPWPFKSREGRTGYVYKWSEGSSFAVPIVATAAALWRMHHGERLNIYKSSEQLEIFRSLVCKTATSFNGGSHKQLYGAGILNIKALLQEPLPRPKGLHVIATIDPEQFFSVNKEAATIERELVYLKMRRLASPSLNLIEKDAYYYEQGSELLKKWWKEGRAQQLFPM